MMMGTRQGKEGWGRWEGSMTLTQTSHEVPLRNEKRVDYVMGHAFWETAKAVEMVSLRNGLWSKK